MPKVGLAPWQFSTIFNPYTHFAMFGGVATGKTYTGSHFAIKTFQEHPELTGFIGSNTYDQMNQATLRELLYWLTHYGFEHVIHKRPPARWNSSQIFPEYHNILSVRNPKTKKVSHAFTRVLQSGDKLRGIEFSWYWIDESRDTPRDTHDIILSRMRESEFMRGLITTTTNGEDWVHDRFVLGNTGDMLYGSMHVPTSESLEHGIITPMFYDSLKKTYSELMAEQELNAKHVNVLGGRAYYAFSDRNRKRVAPWGDAFPVRDRPLVIGCDFNFSPAPMVWMVGQVGPPVYGPNGVFWGDCIHWFRELSGVEMSTAEMTQRLIGQFPGYFYEIYGDMSGAVGTTSNAGKADFDQMGIILSDAEALYSIAVEQMDDTEAMVNPRVRSRVENMNCMAKNAANEVRQTYDPVGCPLFDGDVKMVGWKQSTLTGKGKLDDGGDKKRTHASDGAGYAVYKKFPPGRIASVIEGVESQIRPAI